VSTQTPAIRSGQRIIFLTLDDLAGPVDVTLFERAQPLCAHVVFHSWLLLVGGRVRKRGGASFLHETDPHNVGVTVVAEEVFDLAALASDRAAGMTLQRALGRQRRVASARAAGADGRGSPPLVSRSPREPAAARAGMRAPARLWHASGGSAG
jgi:error-prone DNA polymerase